MKNKIIICSKNKSKNEAVKTVIKNYIDDCLYISLDTISGVSETPTSDEEGIKGCINRINYAIEQDNTANLYIAMEGILQKLGEQYFLCGWTVIYDKELDKYYYGCSARIEVPKMIIEEFDTNKRLSDVVAKYINCTEEEVATLGTNGILTNGAYTRTDEFMDSVLCAITAKYQNKKIN